MRLSKRQLRKIIREAYMQIQESRKPLTETHEIAARIWAENGENTEYGEEFLKTLNRSQSSGHMLQMCRYDEELKDTMIDLDADCEYNNVQTDTVLGWIRQNYCPNGLKNWYSKNPNDPGAYERRWGFFDG